VQLKDPECGIYFDWGQDAQRYQAHVEKKVSKNPLTFLAALNDS
jgi:hypothetical protein